MLDNAIHKINRYPVDKCQQTKPHYPLDSDLPGGLRYPPFEQLGKRRQRETGDLTRLGTEKNIR